MSDRELYDLLIVGAGPAGLSAARTAARLGFRTLVVDRLPAPGAADHESSAVLVPAPGFVSARPMFGGLFFPQVDLWIPETLIAVHDAAQRCLSPGGMEYQTMLSGSPEDAPAVVDKGGLLQLMAEQAAAKGAEFLFETEVTGLLREDDTIVGVQSSAGDIRASVVIAAEGVSRNLCAAAGLYCAPASQQILVVTQEYEAPSVGPQDVGRLVILGGHGAPGGYGTLLMPRAGRAIASFATLVGGDGRRPDCAGAESACRRLEDYGQDPRLSSLLAGARPAISGRSSYLLPMQETPASLVAGGFMAIGDAATPAGYLGILPAIYLGRQAALVAAEAIDDADPSLARLMAYDQFFQALILPALQAEAKTTVALLKMSDAELDRLAELLNWLHLPIPFLGYKHNVEREMVCGLVRQLPLAPRDWELLQRVVGEPSDASMLLNEIPGVTPVSSDAAVPVS